MRDSNVRYFDVTGKHCPSYLVNTQKRADFKKRLEMDHTPSPAHEEGVEWAIENGPLQGNAEEDLMLSVTREQIVVMLYKFTQSKGITIGTPTAHDNFKGMKDYGSISSWAVDAMNWGYNAHLIQGSTDGRFTVTYCTKPELMSKEEIESVGYQWANYDEISKRYDPHTLKEGWNTLPDGEEIYYISNPALGLWADRRKFEKA